MITLYNQEHVGVGLFEGIGPKIICEAHGRGHIDCWRQVKINDWQPSDYQASAKGVHIYNYILDKLHIWIREKTTVLYI